MFVFGDNYNINSVKNSTNDNTAINKDTWLVEFDEGENDNSDLSVQEGVSEIKRKRGGPRKEIKSNSKNPNVANHILDEQLHALLTDINGDPKSYREAVTGPEKEL